MARARKTADIDIVWTDVTALDKFVKGLPEKMRKNALRRATREVAKFTKQLAVQEAPVDTGQLVKSLKVKAGRRSRSKRWQHFVSANVETDEGMFRGDTFYAGFLEFGTDERKTKKGWSRGVVEKNRYSFLRSAIWLYIHEKRKIYLQALRTWISQQHTKGKLP